jgi:hypothetical protein
METTTLDMTSSQKPKANFALLFKALTKSSKQRFQPIQNSLFAQALGQEISQVNLNSTNKSSTATNNGKPIGPADPKGLLQRSNSKVTVEGTAIISVNAATIPQTCNHEIINTAAVETSQDQALYQAEMTACQDGVSFPAIDNESSETKPSFSIYRRDEPPCINDRRNQ